MRLLTQQEAKKLLKKYGIAYVESINAKDELTAKKEADRLGYPVVVKVDSESIIHKSELKAVVTNIDNHKKLEQTIDSMHDMLAVKGVKTYSFIIQKQIKGVEILVGVKKDPTFGPLIVTGAGGVFVELFKDVSLRIAPIDEKEAKKMLAETKAYSLLTGFRGDSVKAVDKLIKILANTSKLISNEKNIAELDFNPVMVDEKGAYVVDARIMVE